PERSTSRPSRRCRETSSINSLICSNVNKGNPSYSGTRAPGPRSGEIFFEEQLGAAQLETRPPVDAALAENQQQVVALGNRADDEGVTVGGDRELLDFADRQLAVIAGDRPRLG